MKLEPAEVSGRVSHESAPNSTNRWPLAALLACGAVLWLVAWYGETTQSIVSIWQRSETFAHGFLIVPISAWLIWRRREAVAALGFRPNLLVLPLLVLVGFGWLLGHLAGAGVVQQYTLVIMIPLVVWAILGNHVARTLAFPLFFLLFAVPFGEFLVPPLMEHTADFTILALRLSGIPVYREGLYFTIPSGNWSVVEACSGLRYLIASVTLGFLYAYLTYRSFMRRALFIAAAVIVPIVANWLRAYLIVMIGHLSGMKYAAGVDHLIYGWVFFGLVMLLLFWIGSFWREDHIAEQPVPGAGARMQRAESSLPMVMASAFAVVVVVGIWPALGARLDAASSSPPPQLQAPASVGDWQVRPGTLSTWRPHFLNPSVAITQTYADGAGEVGLYIGYYRNQRPGAQLITTQNMLVGGNDKEWRNVGESRRTLALDAQELPYVEADLRSPTARLLVWRWYWVDGHYTVNPYWAKLLQARSKLLGRGDDGAVVIAYTGLDLDSGPATDRLRKFVTAMLPAIGVVLNHER